MAENVIVSFALFFTAALLEIGGGYLVWLWLRKKRSVLLGLIGGLILFSYGVIPTFQPASFGRVYAAYGGIFIFLSIIWGYAIDKKKPDRYELIGAGVVLIGTAVIMYAPR